MGIGNGTLATMVMKKDKTNLSMSMRTVEVLEVKDEEW